MHFLLFRLMTVTVVFYNCMQSESTDLPHSSCLHIGDWLQCMEANVELPADFDVSKIPTNVNVVELNMPSTCEHCYQEGVYTYTVKQNAQPFPARDNLETIHLNSMQGEGGGQLPVNTLLANVKQRLKSLGIHNCKIGNLNSDSFTGFTSLGRLKLRGNDIAEIAPNTFQSLSSPGLRSLRLEYNRIVSFDWGVLQPLSESLEEVYLSNQKPGLQTIRRSTPTFSFTKLQFLTLENNTLQSAPKEMLETITSLPAGRLDIKLGDNPFCALHTDCFCCKMKNVFDWANQVKPKTSDVQTVALEYTCGSQENRMQLRLRIVNVQVQLETQEKNDDQFVTKESSFILPSSGVQC